MKIIFRILLVVFLGSAISCGTKKRIAQQDRDESKPIIEDQTKKVVEKITGVPQPEAPVKQEKPLDPVSAYIQKYAPIAQEEMALYKIPASITLAQGILESGAGVGTLSRKANNHFGIKCHGWEGGKVYHDDDRRQECFRKYKDPKYSYRDHSLFLTGRKRYADLFKLDIQDYRGWAVGLKVAGYATDPRYPDKLISLIERYELYRFDGTSQERTVVYQENSKEPSVRQYEVKQGDTLYSIARRYDLTVQQLKEYNNLRSNSIGVGQILYMEP